MPTDHECLGRLEQFRDELNNLQNLIKKNVDRHELQSALSSLKEKIYTEYSNCMDKEKLRTMDDIGKHFYCPVVHQLWADISFSKVTPYPNKELSAYLSEAYRRLDYCINQFKGDNDTCS